MKPSIRPVLSEFGVSVLETVRVSDKCIATVRVNNHLLSPAMPFNFSNSQSTSGHSSLLPTTIIYSKKWSQRTPISIFLWAMTLWCQPTAMLVLRRVQMAVRVSSILIDQKYLRIIKIPENECIYLCGNSLGLLSKTSYALIQEEVGAWRTRWGFFFFFWLHTKLLFSCQLTFHL